MRYLGFLPVSGNNADVGSVACPGANGTLMVTGNASGGQRIVTARLLSNGDLDTSFSGDGKETFNLLADAGFAPGACQPNGDMLIARTVTAMGGEQNLQLVRVQRDTGLPDPTFGSAGVVNIDLDAYRSDLGQAEVPMGINVLSNGDIVLTGYFNITSSVTVQAFVVLLGANGQVKAVNTGLSFVSWIASAVLESNDGQLWLFGSSGYNAYRATLGRNDLHFVNYTGVGMGGTVRPGLAVAVDADTVAFAVTLDTDNDGDYGPRLVVFRGAGGASLTLPTPLSHGATLGLDGGSGRNEITLLPGRRVLYGASTRDTAGTQNGIYLAMAHIGRDLSSDGLDDTFGANGAQIAKFLPDTSGCNANPPSQWLSRVTLWAGRPTFVGLARTDCLGANSDDYLIGRIETNRLFADGFD